MPSKEQKKVFDPDDLDKDHDETPEMTGDDGRENSPDYWKRKYLDSERQKSLSAQELRAQINKKEEENRKLRAESTFVRDDLPPSLQPDMGPAPYPSPTHRGSGPYKLVKDMPARAGNDTIMLPQELPGFECQRIPRMDDIPAFIFQNYGAGLYRVKDKNGEYVHSFTIQPALGSLAPQPSTPPTPAAPTFNPMMGMMMGSPAQVAYEMYKHAVATGDAFLLSQAQEMFKTATKPQDSIKGSFQDAIALVTSMMGMMQQMKGAFGTGMGMSNLPEAVQLKQLELDIEGKRWQGYGEVATSFGQYLERGIVGLGKMLMPKTPDQQEVAAAAARMGGGAPLAPQAPPPARFVPAPGSQATPPSVPPTTPEGGTRIQSPGDYVFCASCNTKFTIDDYLIHLDKGGGQCPNRRTPGAPSSPAAPPAAMGAPTVQAQTPIGGIQMAPTKLITEDMATYLDLMPTITYYIMGWEKGDSKCNPEALGDFVWRGLSIPGREDQKRKLVVVAEKGYDAFAHDPQLMNIVASLQRFPNFTTDEIALLCNAAVIAKMLKPDELPTMKDIRDLSPVVDSFQNHYNIQTSAKGREWFGKFLNYIAKMAGKPQPHPEYIEGAGGQRKPGAGNL